ncbi:MAG: OsmC family peroxiredoxin [Actinobacteria bacterium]|nr:OsmC family peroxiredoxin [Actinomycetota bacterium]
MSAERRARAIWEGTLLEGRGRLSTESSPVLSDQWVTWASRTEDPAGRTSPEELLAAAHAACYAMALSATLAARGTAPDRLEVTATCAFDKVGEGWGVTAMDLHVRGRVPGLDPQGFEEAARAGEEGCPISNAIRGNVEIRLTTELER